MPQLSELLEIKNTPDVEIRGLAIDSRKVRKGTLFFAIKGKLQDGHTYIAQAIEKGASAVIGENDIKDCPVPYIRSKNIRHDLAVIAAKYYKHQPQYIAVVTGTNGKTSTADFVRQFWEFSKFDAASIGTLGFIKDGATVSLEADNTSPDPITMHELLSHVRDCAVLEGSSIGFEQHRLDGLKVRVGGFTNFTRDHLDYHGSMENYFAAKALLFTDLMKKGTAVLNADIPEFAELKKICEKHKHEIISYGTNPKATIRLIEATPRHDGQLIKIEAFETSIETKVPLVGRFQVENILCAVGMVVACGIPKEKALHDIAKLRSIQGRMEQAVDGIYVDYAHTPDALENALKSLRPHTEGKLFVVFGCGGDRDKGKRPQMGKLANDLADVVIVTDDNPRTENASVIRSEILIDCPKAVEIADRKKAIISAVTDMKKGDVLLIAGKGHEKYQIIGTEKLHFDDVEIVKTARGIS